MNPAPQQATRDVIDGRTVWRKHHGGEERRVFKWLLRQVCRLLRTPALLPPRSQTAVERCRTEKTQINRLARLGIRVPDVLRQGDTELYLSDLGASLAQTCRETADVEGRAELIEAGFDALLELHGLGGNVSQAFARNMTWQEGHVGFIDLEEDPLTVMSADAAKARDVLFYVSSTARFLVDDPKRYAGMLIGHLSREAPAIRAEVVRTARRLGWLSPVSRLMGPRGRALGMALDQLRRTDSFG